MIYVPMDFDRDGDPKEALRAAMSCANVTSNSEVTLPTSCGHQRYKVRRGGQPYDDEKLMEYWREWHQAGGPPPQN